MVFPQNVMLLQVYRFQVAAALSAICRFHTINFVPFSDCNCSSFQSSLLSTCLLLVNQSTTKCLMTCNWYSVDTHSRDVSPGWAALAWCLVSFLLSPSTWRIHLVNLLYFSIFGQVVFKELRDNKDKSFNNLERSWKWYEKMNPMEQCYCF